MAHKEFQFIVKVLQFIESRTELILVHQTQYCTIDCLGVFIFETGDKTGVQN